MRNVVLTAERIGDRVTRRGVHRAQAKASIQTHLRHALSCIHVARVLDRSQEETSTQCDAFQRIHVYHWMGELIRVCLEAMRQRVQTRRGSNVRGYCLRKLWVDKRGVRHQMRADYSLLQLFQRVQ